MPGVHLNEESLRRIVDANGKIVYMKRYDFVGKKDSNGLIHIYRRMYESLPWKKIMVYDPKINKRYNMDIEKEGTEWVIG